MIPKDCKRLAKVDFPIAAVSKHSAREKSIRHGHPSTLHLWWARRPLAACRSMLLPLLLPDSCDEHYRLSTKTRFARASIVATTSLISRLKVGPILSRFASRTLCHNLSWNGLRSSGSNSSEGPS